jgi:saccharopine dehydrogenase-like NADP-dependent oxidoreductase
MKILVCGAGKMGTAVKYALEKLGHEVETADNNGEANHNVDFGSGAKSTLEAVGADAVLSCLPYFLNTKLAKNCIGLGIHYFDLGGKVEASNEIKKYANNMEATKNGTIVFTDLGLAPGWVNILAEEGYREMKDMNCDISNVSMYCGGLPTVPIPPWNYAPTWSIEGLYNEYIDDCEVLDEGKIKCVPGMSGFEPEFEYHGAPLEAFCTSGGASHTLEIMQKRGVQHCSYKTLRFQGHWEVLQGLLRDREMSYEEFKELLPPLTKEDTVILSAIVDGVKDGAYVKWSKGFIITHDEEFTAMQKCTAFPCVAAVDALLNHNSKNDFVWQLSYADVPPCLFKENLIKLGILEDV